MNKIRGCDFPDFFSHHSSFWYYHQIINQSQIEIHHCIGVPWRGGVVVFTHRVPTQVLQSLIFVFPFVRPYKVLFLGYFPPRGLIKSYF